MDATKAGPPWKVGELARRTGLTVRALHHYDAIGLLVPTHRTASGHRLYGAADVERLQQVLSLRQLGLGLDEVDACLADPTFSPRTLIDHHRRRVAEQVEHLRRLAGRLDRLADRLAVTEAASVDDFLAVIEEMTMYEKYYTAEQLEQLKARAERVGPERVAEVEAEWPALMAEVRAAMDRGDDPTSPEVRALARRWVGLVREFTGGDPGIAASLKSMWQSESSIHGIDAGPARRLMAYLDPAMEAEGLTP